MQVEKTRIRPGSGNCGKSTCLLVLDLEHDVHVNGLRDPEKLQEIFKIYVLCMPSGSLPGMLGAVIHHHCSVRTFPGFPDPGKDISDIFTIADTGMVEDIKEDRDAGLFMDLQAVCRREPPVIVLHNQATVYRRIEAVVCPDKTVETFRSVSVNTTNVELDFCGTIEPHQVQEVGMVPELSDAPLDNPGIWGIENDELVRVHRDTDAVFSDEIPDLSQVIAEMLLPGNRADRVGCERDQIGRDPEEEDLMVVVPCKHIFKTGDIAADR